MELYLDFKESEEINYHKFNMLVKNFYKHNISEIYAAVAYNSDSDFLDSCIKNKIKLEYYGLLNEGISTELSFLKKAVECPEYITFYAKYHFFHPKLIYFKGYGLFIGSQNMTSNAERYNTEAGVFIPQKEITEEHENQIKRFFTFLRNTCHRITKEDIPILEDIKNESNMIAQQNRELQKKIKKIFSDRMPDLVNTHEQDVTETTKPGEKSDRNRIIKENKKQRERKLQFEKQWKDVDDILNNIQSNLIEAGARNKEGILKDAYDTIVVDQVLHCYYATQIEVHGKNALRERIANLHNYNKSRIPDAVSELINWWASYDVPKDTIEVINTWGKLNKNTLALLKERDLSEDELSSVLNRVNAAITCARQIPKKELNIPENEQHTIPERVQLYAKLLLSEKTKEGLTINQVLHHLLYDETISPRNRIYDVLFTEKYSIKNFKRSTAGEILGWGHPDSINPRNNRINKCLYCLGYNIRLDNEDYEDDIEESDK